MPAYLAVHQAGFDSTYMNEAWRLRTLHAPGYRPNLDLVVAAPDGRVVAVAIAWLGLDGEGQFEPVDTHPDVSLRRAARLFDGSVPLGQASDELRLALGRLRAYLAEAGRDPASFGLGLSLRIDDAAATADGWRRRIDDLRALGATHVSLNAGGRDGSVDQQLERLIAWKQVFDAG